MDSNACDVTNALNHANVLVLGSGPCGLASADAAISAGLTVALLDRGSGTWTDFAAQPDDERIRGRTTGGLGGVGRLWGGQCGFPSIYDYRSWQLTAGLTDTDLEVIQESIELLARDFGASKFDSKNETHSRDTFEKFAENAGVDTTYTSYARTLSFQKLFSRTISSGFLKYLSNCVVEALLFQDYEIKSVKVSGVWIPIPDHLLVILAFGSLETARLLSESVHAPRDLVEAASCGFLEHPAGYLDTVQVIGRRALPILNSRFKNAGRSHKQKLLLKVQSGTVWHSCVLEFHPHYEVTSGNSRTMSVFWTWLARWRRLLNGFSIRLLGRLLVSPPSARVWIQLEELEYSKLQTNWSPALKGSNRRLVSFVLDTFIERILPAAQDFGILPMSDDHSSKERKVYECLNNLQQAFHPSCSVKSHVSSKISPVHPLGYLHEGANLVLAGQATWPTALWCNPTLISMALAQVGVTRAISRREKFSI